MNPAVMRKSPSQSKATRFGFGYERPSKDSPSIQTARSRFLVLVLELRPGAVSDLFNTVDPSFGELLAKKECLINAVPDSIKSEMPDDYILRQPKFVRAHAIQKLIPNWRSLKQMEEAGSLRQLLNGWAIRHHLTDEWCLDHALAFLREFDESDEKNLGCALQGEMRHHFFGNQPLKTGLLRHFMKVANLTESDQ